LFCKGREINDNLQEKRTILLKKKGNDKQKRTDLRKKEGNKMKTDT